MQPWLPLGTGTMNGVTFHYYYAVHSYRRLLAEHGFALVDVHDDPGVSTYYLARKDMKTMSDMVSRSA